MKQQKYFFLTFVILFEWMRNGLCHACFLVNIVLICLVTWSVSFKAFCTVCPEGFYCDGTVQNSSHCVHGVQLPLPCPMGQYCPNATKMATEFPCPVGTFNDKTHLKAETECTACTGGFYCGATGLPAPSGPCQSGYYCTLGAQVKAPTDNVTGGICPAGSYCNEGSNASSLCPPGTYNGITGKEPSPVSQRFVRATNSLDL